MLSTLRRLLAPLLLGAVAACSATAAGPQTAAPQQSARNTAVLVFGGSGQLGSQIAQSLLVAGYPVSVFLRPSSSRERVAGLRVNLIEGDVLNDADVEVAMKSRHFDVVINALGRSEQPMSFYATSGQLIAKWAKATGVSQVILHSSVGVGESVAARPGPIPPFMVALIREKGVAETALIDSGVPYTIIRNDTLRDIAADAPDNARLFGDQKKLGLVSRRGLARLTRDCIGARKCLNQIFHAVDASMQP